MKRKQKIDPLESVLQDYSQRISLTPELSDEQRARAYAEATGMPQTPFRRCQSHGHREWSIG